jgi:hypothetical protein
MNTQNSTNHHNLKHFAQLVADGVILQGVDLEVKRLAREYLSYVTKPVVWIVSHAQSAKTEPKPVFHSLTKETAERFISKFTGDFEAPFEYVGDRRWENYQGEVLVLKGTMLHE